MMDRESRTPRHFTTGNEMSFITSSWMSKTSAENRLADDSDRFALSRLDAASDEVVVVDERSTLRPSQAVENRLVDLLRGGSLPVSHLHLRGLMQRGRHAD